LVRALLVLVPQFGLLDLWLLPPLCCICVDGLELSDVGCDLLALLACLAMIGLCLKLALEGGKELGYTQRWL
jgi:hypothetical protein